MGKINRNESKLNRKVNVNSLKRHIFLVAFVLGIVTLDIRAYAAEQTPEQQAVTESEQQDGQSSGQQADSQDESVETGVEISGATMMYAVGNVNVRKEPNTTSEVLGELEAGTNIFAVELTDEGWYRVVYGGETGYIRGDFLAVFGNMDEWSASEPEPELEPEPIEDEDVANATKGDADNQAADITENDGAAENAEGGAADDAADASAEKQGKGKNNIVTILIIVTLVVVIFVYAVIQIVKENRNSEEKSEDESDEEDFNDELDDESDNEDSEYESEEEDYGDDEDIEIVDLDEDE